MGSFEVNHEHEHKGGGKTPHTWSTTMLLLFNSNPKV